MSNDLQAIDRRIKSITGTKKITSAMKLVSAAKFRKAKKSYDESKGYLNYIRQTIAGILCHEENQDVVSSYERKSKNIGRTCYILITSNRGLCGGFNNNLINKLERQMDIDPGRKEIITIGSKGYEYFNRRGLKISAKYFEPLEKITVNEVSEIIKPILKRFENGEIDRVKTIYTSFVNNLKQEVKCINILPFDVEDAMTDCKMSKDMLLSHEIEYEPEVVEILDYLLPKYLEMSLHSSIIESTTCEQSARRNAMENATKNAEDMLKDLSLYYNRARQAAITNELIEVVSGSETQK
jgi:F-type H+-transporting ATPase subunit gamma